MNLAFVPYGTIIFSSDSQLLNAPSPISQMDLGRDMLRKLLHHIKAPSSMIDTILGITIDSKDKHLQKQ